jgi:hypothetical protein
MNQKIKTQKPVLTAILATALLPLAALAQSTVTSESLTTENTYSGPVSGTREITLGGGGTSNKDFDGSYGAVDFSFGTYFSPRSELVLRQSLSYTNPENSGTGWGGATRLAYDYHFSENTVRPFVGVSAGRIYGSGVDDTWAGGLEGGVKYFVKPQTFILAMASYDWFFDNGSEIENQFSNGQVGWTLGVGFQF